MRFIIPTSKREERLARQKYLYDIFKVYFIENTKVEEYIELVSFPEKEYDYLLILGHNGFVERYLSNHESEISEMNIVILSCEIDSTYIENLLSEKNVFISKETHNDGEITCYEGKPYGFSFEITDTELNLFNSKGSVSQRIAETFIKVG